VDGEPEAGVHRRRPRRRFVLLALAALIALVLLGTWLARKPIASNYLDRELARRGVRATYSVKHVGFRREAVENLVLGDPAHPDLTARYVELELSWGLRRPRVTLVTARGVRLYGRLVGGKLRFGQLDKLLPPPTGAPFTFPDQAIDIADAAIRLDTPAGRIGAAVEGRGNLADGFTGHVAAAAPALRLGGCRAVGSRASLNVAIRARSPHVAGPARFESFDCGNSLALRGGEAVADATLSERLDRWRGSSTLAAAALRSGVNRLARLSGRMDFAGTAAETRGRADLAAAEVRVAGFGAGRTTLAGPYSFSPKASRILFAGDTSARGVAAPQGIAQGAARALASAEGTPVERIAAAWGEAVIRAARSFDLSGGLHLAIEGGRGSARFADARIAAASGARLALAGGNGIVYSWPGGGARFDGRVEFGGGGLPTGRLALDRPTSEGPISGSGRIEPYSAAGERLAFGPIRFTAAAGGPTSIDTVAMLDGPFDSGRVAGLVVPVSARLDGRGGFLLDPRCTPIRFRSLTVGSLQVGPTALRLCPTGPGLLWKKPGGGAAGGFLVASPRIAARIGGTPLALDAGQLRVGLPGPSFAVAGLAARLGNAGNVNRLDIASLSGRAGGKGLSGVYSGLSAALAKVPLLLSQGAGAWSFVGGKLEAGGAVTVADARAPERFHPLVARDFDFALDGNRIAAGGWLFEPQTGTRVARADLAHRLDTGAGTASIVVPPLRFDPSFQPERLTPLTTGVVALVNGSVEGRGDIAWDSGATRSTGTFSTRGTSLAATFGPVENLTTTIHFTDLLNLVTAPGQEAQVGAVHTGIDVFDGHVRYQLLPDLKIRVEGGRWPFAGGELFLEETILDFSKPTPKRLTFRVAGTDAARFIQQMEFSNISATGTFDGLIPMIFDEKGGRIVGGRLVARPEGGTLSYIGELTDKQLGAYGKLAFDALKSLRYNKLAVVLNGALDGEFVAGIELDGIARDPSLAKAPGGGIKGMIANRALTQLAKIPFEFNITVRGPFRAVIGTARSLEDPTNLLQSVLPKMLEAAPAPAKPVQPQESETVR